MNRRKFLNRFLTAMFGGMAPWHFMVGWTTGALLEASKQTELEKLTLIPMNFFTAEKHSDRVAQVFLAGVEVTELCAGFYGSAAPGPEVEGWVDVCKADKDGWITDETTHELVFTRYFGQIRWRGFTVENQSLLITDNPGVRISAGVLESE